MDIISFQFIEVSPSEVLLDPIWSKGDGKYVYEHLKHYCSTFTPLPAATVKLVDAKLTVVRGFEYVAIARELKHNKIRAVLLDSTFDELKMQEIPGILSIVPLSELEAEMRTSAVTGWHIFYFKTRPSPEIAAKIETHFKRFLRESLPAALGENPEEPIESRFDFLGPCLEIKFTTPVANEAWIKSFQSLVSSVSAEIWPIESYQGRRLGSAK
ncbi:MAG TPA: hypothetical protein VMF06_12775 [Candidatus Limnocylindria bacterium]|jgi:hypothetical protein|nr:hypothetical protein [Candidatus Limnocylindria bacterium]